MQGTIFLLVSLAIMVFFFGAQALRPHLDRWHQLLSADLERRFAEGAEARAVEALKEAELDAIRRLAEEELSKYAPTKQQASRGR